MAAIDIAGLLKRMEADYNTAKTERQQQYKSGLADLAQVTGLYGQGYGAGMEHEAQAQLGQTMVGRGLSGTTRRGAGAGEISAHFEDLRRGKIAGALTNMAEYEKSFQDIYPDAGTISHLATGGYSGLLDKEQLAFQTDIAKAPGGALGPPKLGGVSVQYPSAGGGSSGGVGDIGSPDFSLSEGTGGGPTMRSFGPTTQTGWDTPTSFGSTTKPQDNSWQTMEAQLQAIMNKYHGTVGIVTGGVADTAAEQEAMQKGSEILTSEYNPLFQQYVQARYGGK